MSAFGLLWPIALCDSCFCMTYTIKGKCGKCKVMKRVRQSKKSRVGREER